MSAAGCYNSISRRTSAMSGSCASPSCQTPPPKAPTAVCIARVCGQVYRRPAH